MPTSPRLREFDRQLLAVARPALEPHGFLAGVYRSFRRMRQTPQGTLVHIVHFQVGIKALAGRFTANLVVYHSTFCPHPGAVSPETATFGDGYLTLWTRVALLEPVRPSFIGRVFGRTSEPDDRWWPQSEDPIVMAATVRDVVTLVLAHAPWWFETHGTEAACRQEHERLHGGGGTDRRGLPS
jgi:hypothetical protein